MTDEHQKREELASLRDISTFGILYSDEFEAEFRPMTSDIADDSLIDELRNLVGRARKLLGARSDKDVADIAWAVDAYLVVAIEGGHLIGIDSEGRETKVDASLARYFPKRRLMEFTCGFIREIYQRSQYDFELVDSSRQPYLVKGVVDSEIWAAQALVQVANGLSQYNKDYFFTAMGAMNLIVAAECLAIAEFGSVKEKAPLSMSGQNAATARWRRWEPARRLAVSLYENGQWPSRAQAVKAIKEQVVAKLAEQNLRLSVDHAETTIDGWLKSATGRRRPQ